ncbi:hypothetical protein CYMTET_27765 [Cymbomonas tetramitiformis]|uniref:Uncharacterized protein n=1 Tax=Cymbomonas tetramitiformis TaxID=36881 RepID=A0AAE0FPJ3_9CHLO|nr:hypothetical protein CYMTET_27765 [Cymbomonas tetramitiformis]
MPKLTYQCKWTTTALLTLLGLTTTRGADSPTATSSAGASTASFPRGFDSPTASTFASPSSTPTASWTQTRAALKTDTNCGQSRSNTRESVDGRRQTPVLSNKTIDRSCESACDPFGANALADMSERSIFCFCLEYCELVRTKDGFFRTSAKTFPPDSPTSSSSASPTTYSSTSPSTYPASFPSLDSPSYHTSHTASPSASHLSIVRDPTGNSASGNEKKDFALSRALLQSSSTKSYLLPPTFTSVTEYFYEKFANTRLYGSGNRKMSAYDSKNASWKGSAVYMYASVVKIGMREKFHKPLPHQSPLQHY